MNLHRHNLKVLNYSDSELVTFNLIKIIGCIDNQKQPVNKIVVKLNNVSVGENPVLQNIFKILLELADGDNNIEITYCCETLKLSLKYCPRTTEYSVLPLYVICSGHDGKFQAPPNENNDIENACKRITLAAKLLQCITSEKLYEHNLDRRTFHLENSCQIFYSKLNFKEARKMTQEQLWEYLGREIMSSSIGCDKTKYLAFLSCTKYCGDKYQEAFTTHEDLVKITQAYVALGGGGLALFGTACLYTFPEIVQEIIPRFQCDLVVDRRQFLDDSCYRHTQGFCFSTALGSVLHELYHTFSLGHTEEGIMGRGFDNIYKIFTLNETGAAYSVSKNITKTFHSTIEFKEEFESEKLSERLENENKRKECNVKLQFNDTDDTHLMKSCAVFLRYHKWFNNEVKNDNYITFDDTNNLVKSANGVRVVQIRNEIRELVVSSWTFEGKILKYSFQIPEEVLTQLCNKQVIIIAEDSKGNILKRTISL